MLNAKQRSIGVIFILICTLIYTNWESIPNVTDSVYNTDHQRTEDMVRRAVLEVPGAPYIDHKSLDL